MLLFFVKTINGIDYDIVWDGTQTRNGGRTKGELLGSYDSRTQFEVDVNRLMAFRRTLIERRLRATYDN